MEEKKDEKLTFDISQISNINTLDENPSVKDFIKKSEPKEEKKEEVISQTILSGYKPEVFEKYPRKFDFVHPSKVQLPSKGICYQNIDDEDVSAGYIWIYPLTMKEEEILSTNKYIYDGTATIMALNNCIKSNISAVDLLVSDFYYLLLYLRSISISDKFSFNIECPKCGKKFQHDINISEITFDDIKFDEEFKEPERVDLEFTGYTVVLCLPRIKNVREMSYIINNSKSEIGIAEFLYTRTLAIISPDGDKIPKEDWIVFYNNLPHKDSEMLFKKATINNGLQHIIKEAVCPDCGAEVEGSAVDLNNDALFRF